MSKGHTIRLVVCNAEKITNLYCEQHIFHEDNRPLENNKLSKKDLRLK